MEPRLFPLYQSALVCPVIGEEPGFGERGVASRDPGAGM